MYIIYRDQERLDARTALMIADSIRTQPQRWTSDLIWLRRDDGFQIAIFKPYDKKLMDPRWIDKDTFGGQITAQMPEFFQVFFGLTLCILRGKGGVAALAALVGVVIGALGRLRQSKKRLGVIKGCIDNRLVNGVVADYRKAGFLKGAAQGLSETVRIGGRLLKEDRRKCRGVGISHERVLASSRTRVKHAFI